jgi:hypothetical protein
VRHRARSDNTRMTASAYSAYGLVLSSDRQRTGLGESVYQKAARRGELIRIRRGAYCESSHWAGLSVRQRYLLRIRATVLASSRQLVLCGFSAAAVWGMPTLDGWPSEVHVLGEQAAGGRSKNGVTRHPVAGTVQRVEERDNLLVTGLRAPRLT